MAAQRTVLHLIKKPPALPRVDLVFVGVSNGIRTHDPQNHNLVL